MDTNHPVFNKKLLIPIFLFIIVQLAAWFGLFSRLELSLYDAWFRINGVENPGDEIVIVALDEKSIREVGNPPWPRSTHAQLLENTRNAKVVGFDMLFNAPSTAEEDKAFAMAIQEHGHVVHASQFTFENNDQGETEQVLEMPSNEFWPGSIGLGFVNTPTDSDQVVRRVTLADVNTFEVPFPSFSLALAMAAQGLPPNEINITPGQLQIGEKIIPIDNINRAMPHFWGPKNTFTTISYIDILKGKYKPAYFKDKIILVGLVSAADQDTFPTPHTASNMILNGSLPTPGVEIHASTVKSFLTDTWYRKAPAPVNITFLFLVSMVTALVVTNRGPWIGLIGTFTITLACTGLVYGLWHMGWWLNLAAPLVLVFLNYAAITAADFVQSEMARRRTKAMFSRYVPGDVVEEIMKSSEDVKLGGTRQDVTIMFCDIRGFTAYSENKPPEEVVSRLNEYLTAVTHVIFKYNGTLDKYLGDGLMAFFGAPVHYPDHIEKAINAAVDIQKAINKLNDKWAKDGAQPLKVGVGLNSGSVLVGNVGSPERMDYTVIGEDVNLASRVESLTKHFGELIMISERSVDKLDDSDVLKQSLIHLGSAEVKGFSKAVEVYTINNKTN
ncbi:MAG: adenylate/guanylate cyclase domain-containing protein [Firmicutes bacterium]|nr:adenylate/guanylate cyclase domain-containing protein [Bacillota bacterium]